jgi:hypothetical protein
MNRPTFDQTVSVLVKAYLNDTLVHGACSACAVGNIVAAATGKQALINETSCTGFENHYWSDGSKIHWWDVFSTCCGGQRKEPTRYHSSARKEIDATGYTWQELARIEFAFETAPGNMGNYRDEVWMFNGLMSVIDVLATIHNVDLTVKESAKLLFVKPQQP